MFRGHIGGEIRARAVFMSEISGHVYIKLRSLGKKWQKQDERTEPTGGTQSSLT